MAFTYVRSLPTPDEIKVAMPVPAHLSAIKRKYDKKIMEVFTRQSDLFLLVIGPCSADQEEAVCEYVNRLAQLQDLVKEKLLLIPRLYTNKPRTTGEGYKGMIHQPDPQKQSNMAEGIQAIRRLHLRSLEISHLAAADEMLYPENYPYLDDLLSYVAIGARSVENQQHRLTVSGLDIPVGMKNPTSGDIDVMLNSVLAGQLAHIFIYNGKEVSTSGNTLTHGILRGAINRNGENVPNYHYEDLIQIAEKYRKRTLKNSTLIIDVNHANSGKKFDQQSRIAKEVMRSRQQCRELSDMIKGLMIESYLLDGAQPINGNEFGKSITDPCLGWEGTERLVRELAEML